MQYIQFVAPMRDSRPWSLVPLPFSRLGQIQLGSNSVQDIQWSGLKAAPYIQHVRPADLDQVKRNFSRSKRLVYVILESQIKCILHIQCDKKTKVLILGVKPTSPNSSVQYFYYCILCGPSPSETKLVFAQTTG